MPKSRYVGPEYDDCLICQIAQKNYVRLEDIGRAIRVAGSVAYAAGYIDPKTAIEIYGQIDRYLDVPRTGEAFVAYISGLSRAYAPVAEVTLEFADDFNVPMELDAKSVGILKSFCQSRIAFYRIMLGPAVLPPGK